MARLIRTEKEVEGRREEVWLVVEEDALEQWPAGPLDVVGRPAPRIDGPERARGEATFTADLALPGMLHTAVLRSPHARARVTRIDLAPALAAPGVRAAIGPGDIDALTDDCDYEGAAVAAVCADTLAQAARPSRDRRRVGGARPAARPRRGGRAAASCSGPRERERGDVERGLAEADVVVEATYRTADRAAQLDGDAPGRRAAGSATRSRSTPRRSTSGACATSWRRRSGSPADKVRVICESMGGGFGSKTGAGRLHADRGRARAAHGPARRCALTRREENVAAGNRNATIQRLAVGARATGRSRRSAATSSTRSAGRGWIAGHRGADADALRLPEREDDDPRREDQPAADAGVPRPGLRRGHLRARVPARRARGAARPRPARAAAPQPRRPRRRRERRRTAARTSLECYRRAEPHWERRHEVRARSTDTVKRGVGMASQIWYGGGGPPSYAWMRVGSDGRAAVVTAMQDVGTGTKTALAQIAAEELGIPLEHVTVSLGDSARGPVRDALGAARRRRRRWARPCAPRPPTRSGSSSSSPRSAATPSDASLAEVVGAARRRADPRHRRARAEPGRDAGAHLRRPGRRGRCRRRDRRGRRSTASRRSTTSAA